MSTKQYARPNISFADFIALYVTSPTFSCGVNLVITCFPLSIFCPTYEVYFNETVSWISFYVGDKASSLITVHDVYIICERLH